MRSATILILPALLLTACGGTPDLGPEPSKSGKYPGLLPLDQVIAAAGATPQAGDPAADLDARAAALRARAAALR